MATRWYWIWCCLFAYCASALNASAYVNSNKFALVIAGSLTTPAANKGVFTRGATPAGKQGSWWYGGMKGALAGKNELGQDIVCAICIGYGYDGWQNVSCNYITRNADGTFVPLSYGGYGSHPYGSFTSYDATLARQYGNFSNPDRGQWLMDSGFLQWEVVGTIAQEISVYNEISSFSISDAIAKMPASWQGEWNIWKKIVTASNIDGILKTEKIVMKRVNADGTTTYLTWNPSTSQWAMGTGWDEANSVLLGGGTYTTWASGGAPDNLVNTIAYSYESITNIVDGITNVTPTWVSYPFVRGATDTSISAVSRDPFASFYEGGNDLNKTLPSWMSALTNRGSVTVTNINSLSVSNFNFNTNIVNFYDRSTNFFNASLTNYNNVVVSNFNYSTNVFAYTNFDLGTNIFSFTNIVQASSNNNEDLIAALTNLGNQAVSITNIVSGETGIVSFLKGKADSLDIWASNMPMPQMSTDTAALTNDMWNTAAMFSNAYVREAVATSNQVATELGWYGSIMQTLAVVPETRVLRFDISTSIHGQACVIPIDFEKFSSLLEMVRKLMRWALWIAFMFSAPRIISKGG